MRKHIATVRRLIKDAKLFIYCQILYIFLSQLILCSFIWRLQYAWFLFRGGGDRHLFQLSQQLASVRNYFIFFSIIAVVHLFSQAGDFPGCGDFPSVFRCQRSSSFLFQSSKQADFNAHFSTVRKNNFIFSVPYFFLSFPTGTRTSLQVEYNSYVLVGGIGSLLLIFCLCLYSINITSILIKCF